MGEGSRDRARAGAEMRVWAGYAAVPRTLKAVHDTLMTRGEEQPLMMGTCRESVKEWIGARPDRGSA
ncbi:hypothetical protein CKO29_12945 [Allochromatium vinosum]|nr:hypothetical protein [Allochromatium vinosum]